LVDALQLLFVDPAGMQSAQLVVSDCWPEGGAVLPAAHPTIARGQVPEARLKVPRSAAFAEVFSVYSSAMARGTDKTPMVIEVLRGRLGRTPGEPTAMAPRPLLPGPALCCLTSSSAGSTTP